MTPTAAPRTARVPLDTKSVVIPRGQVYVIPHRCKECRFCVDFCPKIEQMTR